MKHLPFIPLFCMLALGAGAQPAAGRNAASGVTGLEHRRAELRLMLKDPRAHETPEQDPRFENVSYDRHLSAQERADLRQQLRQQRQQLLDVKPDRP